MILGKNIKANKFELSDKSAETHPLFKLDLVLGSIKKLKENSDRWIMLKDIIEDLHTCVYFLV